MMKNKKGFTLIELLVVIAIIGLLSTLAVVSLNSARAKARDAKRISDVKQLASVIEIAATANSTGTYRGILPAGCDSVGAGGELTTGCGTWQGVNFASITDPSGSVTPCVNLSAGTCAYSMTVDNVANDDYEICFYLEEKNSLVDGDEPAGTFSIGPGSIFSATCAE